MDFKNTDLIENDLIEIGKRIKEIRINKNLTQKELSDKTGISLSSIERIENGGDTKMSQIIKILNAFNLIENLEVLFPKQKEDFSKIFRTEKKKQRARKKVYTSKWVWGEDK